MNPATVRSAHSRIAGFVSRKGSLRLQLCLPSRRYPRPTLMARVLQGKEDAFEAAKSKLKVDLTEKGFLNPDESFVVGNNKCHFVKARK